jgi:hypothetical protein
MPTLQTNPAKYATPAILKAIRQVLAEDADLARLLAPAATRGRREAAVFAEGAVPNEQVEGEYLTIGPFTEISQNTLGDALRWGSEVTTAIKVVSYQRDVAPGYALVERIIGLLQGARLDVEGYQTAEATLDIVPDAYVELVAGVPVTHFPIVFRIRVHEDI